MKYNPYRGIKANTIRARLILDEIDKESERDTPNYHQIESMMEDLRVTAAGGKASAKFTRTGELSHATQTN